MRCIMKKYLIIFTLILSSLIMQSMSALAIITTDEASSNEYLINRGYSQETIRLIQLSKAQVNGKKFVYDRNEPKYYTDNDYVRFFRKVYMLADPAVDDQKFGQHNINYSVRLDD